VGTIATHLSDCIKAGLPVDVERCGVTPAMEQLILDTVRAPPINSGMSINLMIVQSFKQWRRCSECNWLLRGFLC
jgi:hypothetical protein